MATAMLMDLSKCTGCRACQVACKAWNDLPGEMTLCLGCYDNPPDLSPVTWNRIEFYELERDTSQVAWLFRPVRYPYFPCNESRETDIMESAVIPGGGACDTAPPPPVNAPYAGFWRDEAFVSFTIAVSGKGGTGKTNLAGFLVRYLP